METNIHDILDQEAYNTATDNYVIDKEDTFGGAIKKLDGKAFQVQTDLTNLNTAVVNGFGALNAEDEKLEQADAAEAEAREAADKKLQDNIDAEETAREVADTKLQDNIDAEETARNAADVQLQDNIDMEAAARKLAIQEEATARTAADTVLANKIADNALALDKETAARIAGDQALSNRIDQVETDSAKGIAKASALAALHPLDYDPDNKFDISAAGGFYKSEKAFALGAFYRPSRNVMLSLGTSIGSGDAVYNVGVTVKIGRSGQGKGTSDQNVSELYRMIGELQRRIAQLEAGRM